MDGGFGGAATYYIQQFENSGGLIREGLHAYDEPVAFTGKGDYGELRRRGRNPGNIEKKKNNILLNV